MLILLGRRRKVSAYKKSCWFPQSLIEYANALGWGEKVAQAIVGMLSGGKLSVGYLGGRRSWEPGCRVKLTLMTRIFHLMIHTFVS